ncbi:MAG: hypothetical protein C0407_14790 [Desulfobacca sp.]|nr:hypothetical protein [Desulfobacca sp.]
MCQEILRENVMKSFQEIFDQMLAEKQADRVKGVTFRRSSAADRPPYILKANPKPSPEKKTKEPPTVSKTDTPQRPIPPRALTEIQKQALECFNRHGEMLDEYAGITEIKKAFRRLAKRLHPDKASDLSPETQKMKAYEFHQIHLAYRHLLENPLI